MRPDEFQEKPEHGGNGMARDGIIFSPGLTVPHRSSRSTCQLPLPPSDSTQGIPGRVCRPHGVTRPGENLFAPCHRQKTVQ